MLLATYKIIHVINNLVTGYRSYGVRLFLGSLAILASIDTYAVVPTDNSFDNPVSAPYEFTSPEAIGGATFSLVAPAGAKSTITAPISNISITSEDVGKPYGYDLALVFNIDSANTVVAGAFDARITSTDGSEFRIVSMEIDTGHDLGTSPNLTITGYRDGSSVASDSINTGSSDSSGSVTYTKNGVSVGFGGVLAFNTDWQYIDEIRFTGTSVVVAIDDMNFEPGIPPDSTPPTVTSISSSTLNGTYKVGSPISIQVNFSENVIVASGTPQLTLETGATDRTINYTSGTGSSTLTFTYTVQAGDVSADLDYTTTTALALNGSTIRDAAGNNATLTLATPGAANSLGNNKALVIDGVVPTVTSVNSSTANGTYKIGDVVSVQVNFSEAVTVTGTPQLTLETGATDRTINYASGTGTSTLTFSYTVQAGDISGDLDYAATSSLALGGGTIRDAAGNDATLTLASPGLANSLGNNKALVIDGVAPSVSSIVVSGSPTAAATSVNFTVTFSESVTGVSTDDFALGITGTANGTIASVSGSGSSFTVTVSGIVGNGTIKVNLNASTNIADAAGNAGPVAFTSGSSHTVAIPTAPGAPTIGTATAGDGQVSVTFTAPGSNGGSAITTYTATASPGGAFGTCAGPAACTATVTGLTNGTAYTFTVTATNAIGTSVASGASNSATPKGNQTITFPNPGAQNFGTTPDLSSTASATSSLTVSFTSSTTGVCTITSGGALTFVTAGSCTIDADQAGNTAWNAATTVAQTFTVNAIVPDAPTIGTATAGDTQATVTFTAPASTGGAAIIASGYTVTASPGGASATGSSSPITVTGLTNGVSYTFTVTATNSAGTGSASGASNSVTPAAPQTITFNNPGSQNFGTTPTLTATSTAGGGYPVSFSSSTTGVCTITTGGALTFVTAGTCTIAANQAGDSSYLAALQVSQSFTVSPVAPGAPTAASATAGDTQASIAFTAPTFTGGANITGYTVTVSPADVAPVNGASSPIVVMGLTNGQAYTFTVTATNSAGTGSASVASNSITPAASQTITFAMPGAQNFGTTPTFTATADSGLTPTFTSSTTGVCTITSGGALTFVTAGTCTINADQAGNGSYLPATQVTRSFAVNAVVPGIPTATTASAGDARASVSFTAPVFTGGAAITGYTVTANPGGATATGAGSPINVTGLANGTPYTFTVTATNSVGTGAASTASSPVTPTAPPQNSAPVINQGSSTSVTMSEDGAPTAFALSLTATDGDGDSLNWSVSSVAQHGSASVSGGNVSYIPTANYNGSDSFTVQVSDGEDTASITVNVTITPVNDLPVISGTPATSVNQDVAYSFTPTATDIDTADVLTFSITNKPTWASFSTTTGALTGTPVNADAGVFGAIVISVSDGTATAALPAFEIEVVATIDPLQPVVTPPANLELNATALFTPVTVRQLLGLSPSATQADIDQILKGLASDGVSGVNCCTTSLQGLIGSDRLLLAPGRHEVTWKATNAVGVSGEAKQVINLRPLVSLSKSQIAVRDSDVEFRVLLNGPSPEYPLSIPYVIDASTTATTAEHNLVSGTAIFTQSGQVEVIVPVKLSAVTGFSDSQLVVALGDGINAGAANRHVIDIRQGNVPPIVSLTINQGGVNTSMVTPDGGPVSVVATVTDANKTDTHSFSWIGSILGGDAASASRTIDPTGLHGSHQVQVIVTDSGGAVVQASVYFRVVSSLPVLDANSDIDQDGISDEQEGAGDSDNNGIPNYLDNMPSPNILPQVGNITNSYLIECDPGVRCGLGLFARGSNSGGVQILNDEVGSLDNLIVDPTFDPVGGIFDFTISDLPTPGQSVRVVIPQQAPIPANAVYRKFQKGKWVNFVSDADNALHSAAGNPGYCPPPGTADWTTGLTAGHLCVQLTLKDGGPNDDDGLVNAAVVDPGAVSEAKEVEPPVKPPVKPPVQVNSKGGGAVPALWLLLLGGLVILKRVTPKRLVAVVLAVVSINTQASAPENTYLRVDIFTAKSSQSEADFKGALTKAGHEFTINSYDESRTGYQLAVGYQWSELTYTEVGYLDLGDVKVGLTADGDTDFAAFARDFAKNYPITATGATLVQGLSFKTGSVVTLSAEAGAFIWKGEVELDNATFALEEDDGVDPLAGLKVDLALSDAFSLGLSGRRIFFGDQDVDLYSVSSTFRF